MPVVSAGGAGATRSVVKGGAAGLVGAAVAAGSQFLIVVAVTRGFDARTAGCFFTATTVCLMAAGVLRLDCGNGLIYFIAGAHTATPAQEPTPAGRATLRVSTSATPAMPAAPRGYLRAALLPVVILSFAVAALVVAYADALATALTHTATSLPHSATSLTPATTSLTPAVTGPPPTVAGLTPATTSPSPVTTGPAHVVLGTTAAPSPGADPAVVLLGAALRGLGLALPVIVLADILVSATRGFGVMRPTALLSGVLQPGAQLLLVGAVVLAGASGVGEGTRTPGSASGTGWLLAAAWAAPALPVLALSAFWLRRRMPTGPYVPRAARAFWRYTGPRAVGGAAQAVFQRLDVVVVAVLAGPAQAALYTAATRFKVVGQLVNQGFAQAAQPRLVRAMAEGDLPLARRLYQMTTMWLVLLTWPVWLGYAVLAPWLLRAFGDGYPDGAAVAVVLAATMMLATACGMADVMLIAAGHTAASTANILSAIAVTVALDVALVPSHGALGAALGWSGGMFAKNLMPLVKIARLYGLRPFGAHSLPSLRLWRAEEAT
ncbi:lipopolysaccharide biosynthesis protein [Sphaerisporangium rhizosphaerae]|uniref:Polysaccharide biosynthesis C-terminal domain-containing protein n=1 Tax=Sphaerisporangium rhizosphaerae TaxID=2269375 RepID=A0ABW2PCT5_9ACTN